MLASEEYECKSVGSRDDSTMLEREERARLRTPSYDLEIDDDRADEYLLNTTLEEVSYKSVSRRVVKLRTHFHLPNLLQFYFTTV